MSGVPQPAAADAGSACPKTFGVRRLRRLGRKKPRGAYGDSLRRKFANRDIPHTGPAALLSGRENRQRLPPPIFAAEFGRRDCRHNIHPVRKNRRDKRRRPRQRQSDSDMVLAIRTRRIVQMPAASEDRRRVLYCESCPGNSSGTTDQKVLCKIEHSALA